MKTVLPAPSPRSSDLAKRYGYDEWLVSRFLEYVPDVEKFLDKMESPPTQYIRVNTLKTDKAELVSRLQAKGFELRDTPILDVIAVAKAPMPVGATTEYMLGHYYIQDLSSAFAVHALEVEQDQLVLDIAAAPGGKTTLIAQKMKNTGAIVALEPNQKRARSLTFNLARCGAYNTCVVQLDGHDVSKLGLKFDRVLLDAPCSCEGVIAKDMTRKTSHTPSDVEFCSNRQETLIESAAAAVKPGGLLVYSTCSFAPEENEGVVYSLLKRSNKISLEPLGFGSPGLSEYQGIVFGDEMKQTCRLYPHLHDTTGFYIAKLRVGG